MLVLGEFSLPLKYPAELREIATKLRGEGASYKAMGKQLGVPKGSVYWWFRGQKYNKERKERYHSDPEYYRKKQESARKFRENYREGFKLGQKRWRERHPEKSRQMVKEYRKKHPEVRRKWTRNHVLSTKNKQIYGNKRPFPEDNSCELCGDEKTRLEYHHYDDNDLLKGLWLCVRCHIFAEKTDKGLQRRYFELKETIFKNGGKFDG